MKRVVGFGEVIDGKLVLRNRDTFDAELTQLKGRVEVTVEKARTHRSLNQNSYYWGVVVKLISDYTGYEQDEMHEVLKVMFNSGEFMSEQGEVYYGKSTSKLSTLDFEVYLDRIKRWAAGYGIVIPDPNDPSIATDDGDDPREDR